MNTTTKKTRIDYGQLAANLNYAALEKKLRDLQEQAPPKKRKLVGDLLAPVAARLRELRAKGWTYRELAQELNGFGLPVRPAALRDCLGAKKTKSLCRSRQRRSPIAQK